MNSSNRCLNYVELLIDNHWATLNNISEGNAEIIAFMLAGAICYAEILTRLECQSEIQAQLLTTTIDALQEYQSLEWAVMPSTPENMLAMVAVFRYRKCVITELGGNQTPYTVPVITSQLKCSESQHTCRFPFISQWISKVKKAFR